jgi:alpha-L-rhamnosidase
MNSYNHYAYGSVIDWIYTAAAGIKPLEDYPGFEQVKIAPMPDKRLKWLSVSFETKYGAIRVKWIYKDKAIRYEITTPSPTSIVIDGKEKSVKPGSYIFYGRA